MEYFWLLSSVGLVMGLIGSGLLMVSLRRMTGELRKSLLILFIASIFGLISHTTVPLIGFLGIDVSRLVWNAVPVSFFLAMMLVVFSMSYLLKIFTDISGEEEAETDKRKIKPFRVLVDENLE